MTVYPWSLHRNPPPPTPAQHRWWRFVEHHLPGLSVGVMVLALIGVVLWPYMVVTVPSGQVGVLWKRFSGIGIYCWCRVESGTVLNPEELREEGLHLIWPWDTLFLYELRLQNTIETGTAITKDGVGVTATMNIRFQLKHDSVALLHKFIGPDYIASVLRPEIGSRAREIVSQYTAEEVYSTKRLEIEERIHQTAQDRLGDRLDRLVQPASTDQLQEQGRLVRAGTDTELERQPHLKSSIDILDTLILGIELPPTVVTAINRKIEQYYLAQEYDFRIQREQKESERKRIEAAGIHDFQATVSQGISDSYLRWRGIEATLQLAQSNNTKIVVIGSGKDGLPIILGNVDAPATVPAAAPAGTDPSKGAAAATPSLLVEKTPATGLSSPAPTTSTPDATTTPATGAAPTGPAPAGGSPSPTKGTAPTAAATAPSPTPPTAGSGTPAATTPAASPGAPADKSSAVGAPAAAAPAATRSGLPFGLSDIKGILSGGTPATETRGPAKPSSPAAPAEQPPR